MNRLAVVSVCLGSTLAASSGLALDLKQSKVTQVVNDVQIISAANQNQKAALVNDLLSMPDILRTGAASRAELVAQDQTVTRVGANTIFSFDPANRTLDLNQGSLLFHSPHGKGGGTIHTGSATASVLGTTLIVTTTPNGGFKVLALEGEVEVKFLNGLKQKLDPGHMTYILPGANQLAPVVIFRLDELVNNSLLVKGFIHPLDSLPLIQNEIDQQLNKLRKGKLSDTGLYAGDNAGPNDVEVLDINTVGRVPFPAPGRDDATINQPSPTDASVPTPPNHVNVDQQFSIPGNSYYNGQKFVGFQAHNIFFNTTPNSRQGPLTVDMSPYSSLSAFDFVGNNGIAIEGSVIFNGPSENATLGLIAGNLLYFTPGILVQANVHDFLLSSPSPMVLDDVTVNNPVNNIFFQSGSDVTIENGSQVNAAGGLSINVLNNLTVSGSTLNCDTALLTSFYGVFNFDSAQINAGSTATIIAPGNISFNNSKINAGLYVYASSANGSINITGTSISTHYLTLNSGDGILLDPNGKTIVASGPDARANFTAANLITVNNTDFSSFGVVNMAAKTINLSNVAFGAGSSVNLSSLFGVLNIGSSVSGDVNFIQNVTYGGDAAQNHIGSGITISKL